MKLQYLSEAQAHGVRAWWNALQPQEPGKPRPIGFAGLGRQARAQLLRCANVQGLALHAATFRLADKLLEEESKKKYPRFAKDDYALCALVAGALAQVRHDTESGTSLMAAVGGQEPSLHALRFQRLMQTENIDDFYRQLGRAIQMAGRKADVVLLADDMLAWQLECGQERPGNPNLRLKNRWARDYYLPAREREAFENSIQEIQP